MKILVTGGTGFIGSNIVNELLKNPSNEVTVIGRDLEQPCHANNFLKVHLHGVSWDKLPEVDVVYHEAANNDTQDMDREEMFAANVKAGVTLFEKCYRKGCRKFIYASSTAVYGDLGIPFVEDMECNPLTPYAESKLEFDKYAMNFAKIHDCQVVGLRYCNVYGPTEGHKGKRASMIYQLAKKIMNGDTPKIFKYGEQVRDWIYIKDVVKANLMSQDWPTGIYNCGSGVTTSFNQIIEIINKNLDKTANPEYIENPISATYQNYTCCDMSKSKILGFNCNYTIESGIQDMLLNIK